MDNTNFKNSVSIGIRVVTTASLCLIAVVFLASCSINQPAPEKSSAANGASSLADAKTLANLQTAFDGESNAHAKYLEYAKKADTERYTKVASLFRAAARAEDIHANNHAAVIKQMGGSPKAEVKLPEIKTTKENLEAAVKGETYERDVMYADFLAEARNSGNKAAIKTFNFAKTAEAEHAKLYTEALGNLESWKGGTATFYVCSTCGYTTSNADLEKCPIDFTPKEKFEAIS